MTAVITGFLTRPPLYIGVGLFVLGLVLIAWIRYRERYR